jgi:hypothetical protein
VLERTIFSHKDKTLPFLKKGANPKNFPFAIGQVLTKGCEKHARGWWISSRINSLNSFRFAPVRHLPLTLPVNFFSPHAIY